MQFIDTSVDVRKRKISRHYSLLHEKLIDINVEKNNDAH